MAKQRRNYTREFKGHTPAVEEELRRLRAENQRIRMEREILKKATAFFAGESS